MDDRSPSTTRFWLITAAYLLVAVGWMIYTGTRPGAVALNLTELADLLAGLFAPLAFLWLVYASLAQRAELALQRQELIDNTQTQRQQQEEMQRQANALEAQTARLEAQADATYQPIFVLNEAAHPEDRTHLEISNLGADVLDVQAEGLAIWKYFSTPARDVAVAGILTHWRSGGFVYLRGASIESDAYDFALVLKRLDLAHVRYNLRYLRGERRIELISKQPVERQAN